MDEDMDQLVESVRTRGVITPITLRQKEDGRYEIVSGHRRKKACEIVGLETAPCEIKELTRDEAIILMVESNLQRSIILPSEKAKSYKMRLDAMNRQGERNDLTFSPLGKKLHSGELLAQEVPDSQTQIYRYIRLNELNEGLLNLADEGRIGIRPAVELSYLKKEEQDALLETISYEDATPSLAQAIKMRKFSSEGKLNEDVILSIMCEAKPNQREKFSFPADRLRRLLPSGITMKQTEEYVVKALEFYQHYLDRQRDSGRSR
jgi:ParB family chromosome partitioning protein